ILLRNNHSSLRKHDDDKQCEKQSYDQATGHGSSLVTQSDNPSTRSTLHRSPRVSIFILLFLAFHAVPRNSTLPNAPASMLSSTIAASPTIESTTMSPFFGPNRASIRFRNRSDVRIETIENTVS